FHTARSTELRTGRSTKSMFRRRSTACKWRPPSAAHVSFARLQLEDVRAVVGQQQRAIRASKRVGEIQNTDSSKSGDGRHGRHLLGRVIVVHSSPFSTMVGCLRRPSATE